ncbi:T9SS type A sorting domain-containing protein [uncultured Algibacter sp.]|uniref:T9SS type A sorting domain-containing protein n=1 Tax=uncultured Algibacter sp. TaxID=298659 RepID=UPI00261A3154|nr:T9SS type A sorting domain-containing protein [uncultured Algibacter sp.]
MKTKLLLLLLCVSGIGYSQTQPTVHNATFDNIAKSSGSSCSCSGWINKDIADQSESSDRNSGTDDVVKFDDFESDGIYQEVEVVANSVYTLDIEYQYKIDPTTTTGIQVYILKGSAYVSGYTPAYDLPADAAQSGFGYETVAQVETAANQLSFTSITSPGNTDYNDAAQISFNTGSETSIAIFIRAIGPYDSMSHGDASKDKGWMNGDAEIRMDNLTLVNTTVLSTKDVLASKLNIYPNPAQDFIQIESKDVKISSVQMYSLIGQEVVSSKSLVNNRLDISNLSRGIYLLKVNSDNGSLTKKIVVE